MALLVVLISRGNRGWRLRIVLAISHTDGHYGLHGHTVRSGDGFRADSIQINPRSELAVRFALHVSPMVIMC